MIWASPQTGTHGWWPTRVLSHYWVQCRSAGSGTAELGLKKMEGGHEEKQSCRIPAFGSEDATSQLM